MNEYAFYKNKECCVNLVQNLRTVDNLGLAALQHLADLSETKTNEK